MWQWVTRHNFSLVSVSYNNFHGISCPGMLIHQVSPPHSHVYPTGDINQLGLPRPPWPIPHTLQDKICSPKNHQVETSFKQHNYCMIWHWKSLSWWMKLGFMYIKPCSYRCSGVNDTRASAAAGLDEFQFCGKLLDESIVWWLITQISHRLSCIFY